MTSHDVAHDFRRAAITALEGIGISVEFSHHEVAPGQQEIDLRYADALSTADNIMTFRHVIKEVALSHGGSRHVHAQAVHATSPAPACTPTCRCSRATATPSTTRLGPAQPVQDGALVHRRAARARPRDHRRHQPVGQLLQAPLWGFGAPGAVVEAPTVICWGHANRSALVRVPRYKPGKANSTRVELRSPDSACNPYLAFAVLLAAGNEGDRGRLRAPCPAPRTTCGRCPRANCAHSVTVSCRTTSAEALRAMEESELARRDARRARVRLLPAQQARGVGGVPRGGQPVRAAPLPPRPLSRATRPGWAAAAGR